MIGRVGLVNFSVTFSVSLVLSSHPPEEPLRSLGESEVEVGGGEQYSVWPIKQQETALLHLVTRGLQRIPIFGGRNVSLGICRCILLIYENQKEKRFGSDTENCQEALVLSSVSMMSLYNDFVITLISFISHI